MVCDKNTYGAAGEKVCAILKDSFNIKKFIFEDSHLLPNERALGRLLAEIDPDTSLILAVGSGTINDLCRILAYKLQIKYMIVCTAPSMDGYASVVSPLIINGIKTTYMGVYPLAILADMDIIREAPMYMLCAGLGDILGKYTSIADWKISNLMTGEYFCPEAEELVKKVVKKCVSVSSKIPERDLGTVNAIIEGLILSGIAIGMVGNSRPASGEEHKLGHCWEEVFIFKGADSKWLHGNYVGVAALAVIHIFKYLKSVDIKKVYEGGKHKYFDRCDWEKNIFTVFGGMAPVIIKGSEGNIAFDEKVRTENMLNIMDKWNDICRIIDELPEPAEVEGIMKRAGCVCTPQELGINRELFRESLTAAKFTRNRYGVMQILEDMGIINEAADAITSKFYK